MSKHIEDLHSKVEGEGIFGLKTLIPLNIQEFGDEPAPADPTPAPADPAPTPADPTPAPAEPTPPADPKPADPKTFSQEDVNAIAAREAKKAKEAMLKEFGIEDFESAKDGMEKFKQWQESQKTESEKQAEAYKKMEQTLTEAQNQANQAKAEVAALKNDINPDSLSDVITLANNLVSEDVTIEDAIKQVAEKYPHFKRTQEEEGDRKKPNFSQGKTGDDKLSEADKWLNAFKM